ncbi:MAG: class I SAM-dependent methyltransferase [Planctomycetes bacterium]|nr:class I SAM-dependent methyltransferase [Planctomycetota bacterium]MCW8137394.1 class I SAM-dependent methyltransferase [Planctomycetota bacterium]
MATQLDIERTYDYMDQVFRRLIGPNAAISCAFYNGDYTLTLEQAHQATMRYILDGVRCAPGQRILDVGCGWGPVLKAVKDRGAIGVGVSLSPAQVDACRASGFDARLADFKTVGLSDVAPFDGVTAVGPLEHFCSPDEFVNGQQDRIYRDFFEKVAALLKPGGRLYLQTMLFGDHVPDPRKVSVDASFGSDSWLIAHVMKIYPNSWLPVDLRQILRASEGNFRLMRANNGRMDYIQTMNEWTKRLLRPDVRSVFTMLKLGPRLLRSRDDRRQLLGLIYGANHECFRRGLMTHERLLFEKV